MNIGVQAQLLVPPRTGTGQYTYHLLGELFRIDMENFYDLLLFDLTRDRSTYYGDSRGNFKYSFVSFPPFKIFRGLYKLGLKIPVELFFGRHDLHFSSTFYLFPVRSGKKVVTIYDLAYLEAPQFITPAYKRWQGSLTQRWAKESDGIVTISQYTRDKIVEVFGVEEEKVVIARPGLSGEFEPVSDERKEAVKKKYKITKPFILYLGTIDPRKNIATLVRAYAGLKNRGEFNLVVAGKRGWMHEELEKEVVEAKVTDDVIFTDYVPDDDRWALYGAAEVFVYPSFFEGFGMPPVEAQACGTPVITSNVSALPEAVGEGALLVDPQNTGQLTDVLDKLLSSPKLREELVKKGFTNARRFSWEDSAKAALSLFYASV